MRKKKNFVPSFLDILATAKMLGGARFKSITLPLLYCIFFTLTNLEKHVFARLSINLTVEHIIHETCTALVARKET